MAEYDIDFAKELVKASELLYAAESVDFSTARTILYLSCLSMEIALKYFLETAGMEIAKIKKCSHDLEKLLVLVSSLTVDVDGFICVPASRLRSITMHFCGGQIAVGAMISGIAASATRYPAGLRYGDALRHYPFPIVLEAAKEIIQFINKCQNIQLAKNPIRQSP